MFNNHALPTNLDETSSFTSTAKLDSKHDARTGEHDPYEVSEASIQDTSATKDCRQQQRYRSQRRNSLDQVREIDRMLHE
ncbi:hypothetical protein Acr_00g0064210 [Actinidia rufa]|uniref:Uncharacterized protein n=1 Tax=Actinidia rufa TaxID=165716 RepID=A0A7J0DPG4_9ERIC|nr:hypothetical protein Acr_00g0064210 [Actinidia rufa]